MTEDQREIRRKKRVLEYAERIGYTRVWVDPFQRRLLFCLPIEQRAERQIDVLLQLVQSW
jgi:hypothetical protein